jgi:hypothetical protein
MAMTRFVNCVAMMLILGACGGGDGSGDTAFVDESTPIAAEDVELAEDGALGEIDGPDGADAIGAAECQPVFAGCNPRTCNGLAPECDLGEFFSECIALLNFHCGPR